MAAFYAFPPHSLKMKETGKPAEQEIVASPSFPRCIMLLGALLFEDFQSLFEHSVQVMH